MVNTKKDFIRNWYDKVWNNADEAAIDDMFHEHGKAHGLNPVPVMGPAGFKVFYRAFNDAYKNIHIDVDETFEDGDTVIALCTVTAVHKQSGNPIHITGTSITLVRDNQIIEGWNHFDFLSLNLQTGKIRPEQLA
jgi:hypothetical protein